jgi:hypothetical protein
MTEPRFRPRLGEDQGFIDQIEVHVQPRFKTSGLSGDEWRTSIVITALRKGRVVKQRTVGNMDYATRLIGMNDWWLEDEAIPDPRIAEDLCDQYGCSEPWTVLYKRVKDGCGHCGSVKERGDGFDTFQAFCERHAHRGDCSLHDSDDNYQPVEGAHPSEQVIRSEDESPSVFGGIIHLSDDDS